MTDFRTRKADKQVFPIRQKVGRDSGSPSLVGVDRSQVERKENIFKQGEMVFEPNFPPSQRNIKLTRRFKENNIVYWSGSIIPVRGKIRIPVIVREDNLRKVRKSNPKSTSKRFAGMISKPSGTTWTYSKKSKWKVIRDEKYSKIFENKSDKSSKIFIDKIASENRWVVQDVRGNSKSFNSSKDAVNYYKKIEKYYPKGYEGDVINKVD